MSIEQDMVARLEATTPAGPHKARNIDIVLHYYGFGGAPWPTMEETAEAFGVGTRERVRQILGAALPALAGADRLPSLRAASRLVRARPFWTAGELAAKIMQKSGDRPGFSVRALLSLMHDLGLAGAYEAYDHDLEKLTRQQLAAGCAYALVRADAAGPLQAALQEARRLSNRLGLANAARLAERLGPDAPAEAVKALLTIDPACWCSSDGTDFWYAVEGPENALVALAAKVFAVTDEVTPARLAETLCNALHARAGRGPHPDRARVLTWIHGSRSFRHEDGRVVFLGKPGELSRAERELVSFLAACGGADYPSIKAHLRARGVLASMIAKAATQSPVVHVDRSRGMRAYRYSLVGRTRSPDAAGAEPPVMH